MSKEFDSLKTCKIYPANQQRLEKIQANSVTRVTLAALANAAIELGLGPLERKLTTKPVEVEKK